MLLQRLKEHTQWVPKTTRGMTDGRLTLLCELGVTLACALRVLWWRVSKCDPGRVLSGQGGQGSLLSTSVLAVTIILPFISSTRVPRVLADTAQLPREGPAARH